MQVEHKIKSFSVITTIIGLLFLAVSNPLKIMADNYEPGEDERRISVDKKIRSINDKDFSNNIESSTKIFKENDTIEYSIAVENSGKLTLNNIEVNDRLPSNLSLIFYPGTYDRTNNKINWKIDELKPAEIKTYYIRAKIIETSKLNLSNGNLEKLTNYVDVRSDTGTSASDQASCYVGAGVTTIPKTGASLPLQTLIVLTIGSAGIIFRKYARGY
jgi:uncharacterized repeat protein (TIGR01451 family)